MQNEERINGLENQVRTLKRIVYGFGCILVAGIVVGATNMQTVPDLIQAKKFEVVNDEGKVVAKLSATEDGGRFDIRNKDSKLVGGLIATEYGGMFSIRNKDGKPVAQIYPNIDGAGGLSINNNDGKAVVLLSNIKNVGGMLLILDNKGKTTSTLP